MNGQRANPVPWMVSVDDHIVEPADLWSSRLAQKYQEVWPHVVRERVPSRINPGAEKWADVWYYEQARVEILRGFAAVGYSKGELDAEPMTYDEMRPGCYEVAPRLADMDLDGIEASVCFPNAFVRFCGQRFLEAADRELALQCVQIYNDWLAEEWQQPSEGRLFGSGIIPLWDSTLAAAEVRRNAERGLTSVCFSEIPARLGLPSMYGGYWEPFLAACEETGTVINVHIGSSSVVHTTSDDAPLGVRISNHFGNSSFSLTDWLVSGAFVRYPNLKVALSEGQAGWIPYLMSRLDGLWEGQAPFLGFNSLPKPPSSYLAGHVFACVFDDPAGMRLIDQIGEDSLCFEADYPHNDGSWPESRAAAGALTASLTQEQAAKLLRTNGAKLYRMQRVLQESAPVSQP